MDVAFITTRPVEFDAMSNFTMASAAALKGSCGRVSVYAFAYDRPGVEGIEVRMLGGKNRHSIASNIRALLETSRLSRELSRFDALVLVNPDIGSMPACHLAKRHNPSLHIVWTFHGLTPPRFLAGAKDRILTCLRRPFYIMSMKRSDRVQVFSRFIGRELAGKGVDAAKIEVIPFGVDLARLSSGNGKKIRERHGIGERFLVLYVGRLVNFKHVDELIEAVRRLPENACLLVVGGGPERPRLEARAKSPGVEGRVTFAGRVPDEELPDYYAACDVWATASRHEGFCVPIIEAMAAGKPVIVPDIAAMPETADGAGLIYSSGDLKDLADKLLALMREKSTYGTQALARASMFEMAKALGVYVNSILSPG
jgi:glycosyltransferase involved in cell wall biosynthesis